MLGPDEELQERCWSLQPLLGDRGSWQEQGHAARSQPAAPAGACRRCPELGERLGRQTQGCQDVPESHRLAVRGARAHARGVPVKCQLRCEKSSI